MRRIDVTQGHGDVAKITSAVIHTEDGHRVVVDKMQATLPKWVAKSD